MSVNQIIEIKCDRCGCTMAEETGSRNPANVRKVAISTVRNVIRTEQNKISETINKGDYDFRKDLCDDCLKSLNTWWDEHEDYVEAEKKWNLPVDLFRVCKAIELMADDIGEWRQSHNESDEVGSGYSETNPDEIIKSFMYRADEILKLI